MKTLVLVTSQFPFGKGETFIRTEYPFLVSSFERIIIIAQNVRSEKTFTTSSNTTVYRYKTSSAFSDYLHLPGLLISHSSTIKNLIRDEIESRKNVAQKLSLARQLYLLKRIIKAIQLKHYIQKIMIDEQVNGKVVFYSYWLKTGAHSISMLDYQYSVKIARAHGSDLYEEKTAGKYLPLQSFTAQNLDAIFFISNDGRDYFSRKYSAPKARLLVSYLGVNKPVNNNNILEEDGKFRIVSCSNMIALKRIDLVINALGSVNSDAEIEWIHFGDGILRRELEELAKEKLGTSRKIKYMFMGHVSNDYLLAFYSRTRIDLFLNTSSTEGVPVSIMEAQSYGIPVIATDTGGLKEILPEGTGTLLRVDLSPEELAGEIERFINMPAKDIERIRTSAYENWNLKFNAATNYKDFILQAENIFPTKE